ncbi:MAG TPA: thioredoxin domain-containing protein, partial [Thermoanaerobaculia bacterium]|nr:thioredoxin domain-containing protein [Thermoanaerobaculia bacterium]
YVWSRAEVMELLGPAEGSIFCALYDVTERGNWEGHNILNVPRDPESVAGDFGVTMEQLADIAARGKCKLYGRRSERVPPARDEKILSGWNGWMLGAFAEGCLAFGRHHEAVRKSADFLLGRIDGGGRLVRHARILGLLEDYAGAAWGLTLAYEAVHERRYLDAARALIDQVRARFADEAGGFFDTPVDHETLITRPKDLFDNATPSGNAVACDVLQRLALLYGDEESSRVAERALQAMFPLAERYPSGFGFLLGAAEWRAGKPKEIVLTGPTGDERFEALERVVGETFLPHRVIVAGEASRDLPLMEGRDPARVMAYVCEGYLCREPTDDPERLRALLQ